MIIGHYLNDYKNRNKKENLSLKKHTDWVRGFFLQNGGNVVSVTFYFLCCNEYCFSEHMIKGLDDDEIEFLDLVDRSKLEEERKKSLEEAREMADFRNKVKTLQEQSLEQRIQNEIKSTRILLPTTIPYRWEDSTVNLQLTDSCDLICAK